MKTAAEFLARLKENTDSNKHIGSSELRQAIIDLIPGNDFEMAEIALDGDIHLEVECYGVSIRDVLVWSIIEQMEQAYPFPEDADTEEADEEDDAK